MSRLARATALMTVGTVLSRVTGLLRLVVIAAAIGVAESRLADTYNLANTFPNIIYELILGGILTSVFVPVFVELLEKEGREKAWEVASAIINLALVITIAVATLAIIAAPLIASFYAGRLEGAQADLQHDVLTFLLRLFIPQMVFYALAAITAGLLNSHKRFAAPTFTPILNNLTVIAGFLIFSSIYSDTDLADISRSQLWLIGLGTTAGVVVMALTQLPFLRGLGRYRFTLSVKHPAVRKLGRLSTFVIGYVITNQIGYLLVQWLANGQQGGYSAYVFAFTFFLLPHGLFAVSVITALLPTMSEHAVNERWDAYRERLSIGTRASLLLLLPASVGFFILAKPIVSVLLEHGVTTAASTELVADVLRIFVIGLVPFSLFQLYLRAFYALHDSRTPFLVNIAAVGLNSAINVPMFLWLGVEGLAVGLTVAYFFGAFLQARILSKRVGGLDARRVTTSSIRIATASTAMGLSVWGSKILMDAVVTGASVTEEFIAVGVPVAVGVGSYLGLLVALNVEELGLIRGLLVRRSPDPLET